MKNKFKKQQQCAHTLKEGGVGTRSFIFLSGKTVTLFSWPVNFYYSDKFPKCFAVRAVWNVLQPQISGINVVSNLIRVRSRIRRQVRLTRKNC